MDNNFTLYAVDVLYEFHSETTLEEDSDKIFLNVNRLFSLDKRKKEYPPLKFFVFE